MTDEQGSENVDAGSYEVIRARLSNHAETLRNSANTLNERRKAAFGGLEMSIVGNERVRTENNCVPRDIVMVHGRLLFGYNVFIGLKTEVGIGDVFSLHRFDQTEDGFDVGAVPPEDSGTHFLAEPRFAQDFQELYRFYKSAKLIRLSRSETQLLAVFQIGATPQDVRVFRWGFDGAGVAQYRDNRGERDHFFPPQHEFEWSATGREDQISGAHPHISILNEVFIDTIGGDLTVKVENNTAQGEGVYTEPVDDPRQSLDDGSYEYAKVGTLILLRITPYNEQRPRHLVFSTRTHAVARIDAIGRSCVELPEDHGIVFPGGYFLQDGRHKLFDGDFSDFEFERRVISPNGEDVLFVFHQHERGEYALFSYNLIRKDVANPLLCNGYSLFSDGRMIVFRHHTDEPTRVHQMQIWQTPFVSREFAAAQPQRGGYLGKIGNADLVRGISDALSIRRMIEETEPSRQVYEDLIREVTRTLDAYHWLGREETCDMRSTLLEIRTTAELVIGEFDKVVAIRARAEQALTNAITTQETLLNRLRPDSFGGAEQFMDALRQLRAQRGHLISLREMRYMDGKRLEQLETQITERFDTISAKTLTFLADDKALAPVETTLGKLLTQIEAAETTRVVGPLADELEKAHQGVNVLSEVVAGLKSEDPTLRTRILERISEVFGQVNRVRATLTNRQQALAGAEGRAEFAIQFQLFKQSADSAISLAATPDACEEQLAQLMLQLEELEARFGEFDEFLGDLTAKREEVHEIFSQKKQQLLDERQRRASNLMSAAERIISSIARRGSAFESLDELNGFFAADPMVQKLRDLSLKLQELGDSTRADEVLGRLKSAAQNAQRSLRDKSELFEDGAGVIRLGQHRFNVNTQSLELTIVPQGDGMALTLTGTDFKEAVTDPEFLTTRSYWNQQLVSESDEVYRGEYLAYTILVDAERGKDGGLLELRAAQRQPSGLLGVVRRVAVDRYDEGYERGLHDADATAILEKLLDLRDGAGLLRYPARVRNLASLFWAFGGDDESKTRWTARARSLGRIAEAFAHGATSVQRTDLVGQLQSALERFLQDSKLSTQLPDLTTIPAAIEYLLLELAVPQPRFVTRRAAESLVQQFEQELDGRSERAQLQQDLEFLEGDLAAQFELSRAWLSAYVRSERSAIITEDLVEEAVCCVLTATRLDREPSSAAVSARVEGLLGQHRRIDGRCLELQLDEFLTRLGRFSSSRVPGYRHYRTLRSQLVSRERRRLRIDEFVPKTLASFVRNRLINEVYLPLMGDNFAKQLGAAGEKKRTDLMGLLLLISPPGYGKTTLMEYIAGRLGLVFMKINGPALGHQVTSLDPSEAPNVTARQEIEKLNLGLEMGNNVMLYLDDIQHTNPELLQKFISLCDAQRRIEGVWNGQTKTYDLRGKKFCVVMAGNPYTESGERFQIPDMLANRADTYNLGDVLSGREDAFALSFVENAITSNSVLAPLAMRDQSDLYTLVKKAQGEDVNTGNLSHAYGATELEEITKTLTLVLRVQRALLKINQQYIASASTADSYRTEPPFKLQGSYRNMCKLAEKISPAMNTAELEALLRDHYQGEAQTLTSGTEQNLLKLAELLGTLTPAQSERWESVKATYRKEKLLGGSEDDGVTRVTRQLGGVSEQLQGIRDVLSRHSPEREPS